MRRFSSKAMVASLTVVLMIALFAALTPATAQAGGWGPRHGGGGPGYGQQWHNGGSAHFNPNHLPRVIIRKNDDQKAWFGYKLQGGHYVRFFIPRRFGDGEQNYRPSVRALIPGPVLAGVGN